MPTLKTQLAAPSPDHVDLSAVGRAVLRKLPILLLTAGLVGAATAGILSTMAAKYLSQAQLEIRGNGSIEAGGRPDKEAVGTHVRGLMSTELALKMAQSLQLTKRPDFNSALEPGDLYGRLWRSIGVGGAKAGETDEDRLMQAYFKSVRAYQVRDTRSVIIDCTTSDAKFSADCANTLGELYRSNLSGRAVTENTDVRAKLQPQVQRLTREATEAEALATEFRGQANLFQGGTQATQLKDQQLGELTAELTRAATARGDAEARATAAREMSARGIAAANPDVQKSTLIPRMEEQRVTLERQISELSATLLRGHPRMKQLTSELAGLQGQIRAEVQKVVESLGNDARIAADREAGVRRRVDEIKRTVVSSAPDTAKLAQLENQAKAKRAELERLQRQYETAASSAGAGVGSVEVEFVSRAYPSNEKVFPKIGTMAPLAAFAAFILGLAGVLTYELVRGARPIVSGTVVAGEPSVDALSVVHTSGVEAATNPKPSARLETPAGVAHAIAAIAKGSRGFRVLITTDATVAGNGREIIDFAVTLADKYQHTILVEWAGGGGTLAGCAGVANSTGTAQLLAGAASLEDAIQKYPGSKLDIIPAGAGSSVGDGDTAAMLLDALDEIYEFVIVCGPSHNAALLFEAVQGRFDAGVLVCDGKLKSAEIDKTVKFLGFDVPDFPVFSIIGMGKMGLSTGLTPLESGGRAPNQSPRRSVAATTGQT